MIDRAQQVIDDLAKAGGTFSWEWPSTNELWREQLVQDHMNRYPSGVFRKVAFAAIGGRVQTQGREVTVSKCYLFFTTSPGVAKQLEGLETPPSARTKRVRARGAVAESTAIYPGALAKRIWAGLHSDAEAGDHPEEVETRLHLSAPSAPVRGARADTLHLHHHDVETSQRTTHGELCQRPALLQTTMSIHPPTACQRRPACQRRL